MGAVHHHVRRVEKDNEDPIPGIRGRLQRLPLGAHLGAIALRSRWPNDDVLEGFDLLENAVLEDLELLRLQVEDRLAVLEGVGVDPDEVRLDAKLRRRLAARGPAASPAVAAAARSAR